MSQFFRSTVYLHWTALHRVTMRRGFPKKCGVVR